MRCIILHVTFFMASLFVHSLSRGATEILGLLIRYGIIHIWYVCHRKHTDIYLPYRASTIEKVSVGYSKRTERDMFSFRLFVTHSTSTLKIIAAHVELAAA